ncbi:MAG: CBS domain-containing protein [Myxococcales bacterium]|nr:CBS domain-containing protein [Myxococcales bacterium]
MPLWSTPVREYMSHALIGTVPSTPIEEARTLLVERDVSALPVVDGQKLVGILSTTDLWRGTMAGKEAKTVAELMTTDVATIDEGASLRSAAEVMLARKTNRVIVLRKGRPVAVHSTRDAMRAVLFHHVEAPLSRVMHTPVVTVSVSETIAKADALLKEDNTRGLVVLDGKKPVGAYTHTESLRARMKGKVPERDTVESIMSYETICLDEKTPLYRAAGHAVQMGIRRIFALKDETISGIVTGFDLVTVMTLDDI